MPLTRRAVLALAACPFLPQPALSAGLAAVVTRISGPATARLPDGTQVALTVGLDLPAGTRLGTGDALLELALSDGTRLNAGRRTSLALAAESATSVTTGSEPSLTVSGIAVLDRRGTGAPASVTVSSDGFDVLLANSRVFLDSIAQPAVLVQDGTATVVLGSEQIVLAASEGIDFALTEPASPPVAARWAPERVAEAFAKVGLSV